MIRSPQAMPDILPVPWPERSIADIGFPSAALTAAFAEGIRTLKDIPYTTHEELLAYLVKFPGIGAKTAIKVADAYQAYRGDQ